MSTFIVIGAGLAAENFIFTAALSKKSEISIIQLANDAFYPACATRSTAIVAARGISTGHSDLGNLLVEAYDRFSEHVKNVHPEGIFLGTQWTGTTKKVDEFKKRYPECETQNEITELSLKLATPMVLTSEPCFVIDPDLYLSWLRKHSQGIKIERFEDAASEIKRVGEEWEVTTQKGQIFKSKNVFMGVGAYQRFWTDLYPEKSAMQSTSTAQGSYLVRTGVDLGAKYFSLTLNGCNLIYHPHTKKLIIGSTTVKATHHLPDVLALREIYQTLKDLLPELTLSSFESFEIRTGLREKARGRRPYLEINQNLVSCGGFYKNGYSLGLYLAEKALKLYSVD